MLIISLMLLLSRTYNLPRFCYAVTKAWSFLAPVEFSWDSTGRIFSQELSLYILFTSVASPFRRASTLQIKNDDVLVNISPSTLIIVRTLIDNQKGNFPVSLVCWHNPSFLLSLFKRTSWGCSCDLFYGRVAFFIYTFTYQKEKSSFLLTIIVLFYWDLALFILSYLVLSWN